MVGLVVWNTELLGLSPPQLGQPTLQGDCGHTWDVAMPHFMAGMLHVPHMGYSPPLSHIHGVPISVGPAGSLRAGQGAAWGPRRGLRSQSIMTTRFGPSLNIIVGMSGIT